MEYRINQRTGDRISVIGIGSGYITEAPEKEAMEWLQGGSCSQDVQISREVDYFLSYYRNLAPVVFLSYEREAFFSEERIYKTSFSKYGTAYQSMIYPGLVQPVYAKATEPGTVREAVCYG